VQVYVEAFGCTQNFGAARLMREALAEHGHGIARREEDADAMSSSRRVARLRFELGRTIHERFVGRECEILTTEPGKDDTMLARTREYQPVVLREDLPIGEFLRARIDTARPADLMGQTPPSRGP